MMLLLLLLLLLGLLLLRLLLLFLAAVIVQVRPLLKPSAPRSRSASAKDLRDCEGMARRGSGEMRRAIERLRQERKGR